MQKLYDSDKNNISDILEEIEMDMLPQIEMSFILTGQENCLEKITNTLEIVPSHVKRKEEYKLAEFSNYMWELTTGKQYSKSVNFQSQEILKMLKGKEKQIKYFVNHYKLKTDLLIIIHAQIGDGPEISLSQEIIKFAAEIAAEISFDIYYY